jgi:hypothetical protein
MSACEKCWTEASWRARITGTTVAEQYPIVLAENDSNPEHNKPSSTRGEPSS